MPESLALFDADLAPAAAALVAPLPRGAAPPATAEVRDGEAVTEPMLLAVDGNALVHRAFHAYGGTAGGARYGFFALLSVVCDQVTYDGLVVGFDCREHSRRRATAPAIGRRAIRARQRGAGRIGGNPFPGG